MDTLLQRMKEYAAERSHDVTWAEVLGEFRSEYDELPQHKRRRIRVDFEEWITRIRVRGKNE